MKIIIPVLYTIAFGLCVGLGFFLVRTIRQNNVMTRMTSFAKESFQYTIDKTKERKYNAEEEYRKHGKKEKESVFYRIDIMLEKMGIRKNLPFLVTEIFLLLIVLISIGIGILVNIFTKNMLFTVAAFFLNLLFIYISCFLRAEYIDRKIEENILQFADLLESYSLTSDDIIDVFDNVYEYLDEPLRGIILDCVTEVKFNGDINLAFQRMRVKADNRKFSELLFNIEECSKNNADYGTVVRGMHELMEEQQGEQEERKRMANGARLNILIMLGVYVMSIKMLDDYVQINIIDYLQQTSAGEMLLCFLIAVFGYTIYKLFTLGKK